MGNCVDYSLTLSSLTTTATSGVTHTYIYGLCACGVVAVCGKRDLITEGFHSFIVTYRIIFICSVCALAYAQYIEYIDCNYYKLYNIGLQLHVRYVTLCDTLSCMFV